MALTTTQMAEAAIRARGYYGDFEGRMPEFGAFQAFLTNAMALLPKDTIERLKSAQNARSAVFPILTKQLLTVITARACAITGSNPASVKPSITSVTRGFEVKVYPKVSDNNYISEQDQFANGLSNGIRSVGLNLDTYAAAQLEANKSTGLATVGLDGLTIASNAYRLALANRNDLYMYVPTIMARNDLGGATLNNIASTEALALINKYESFATANNQDLLKVLRGDVTGASGMRHYLSNRITNGTGVSETHYLAPFGSIGVFVWNDSDAINRRTAPNGGRLYTMADPILGITWDVLEVPVCEDLSATYGAGYERTMGTAYQFAADFGFMKAYSSDGTSPIMKLEVLTA